jgi:hypothetical protein
VLVRVPRYALCMIEYFNMFNGGLSEVSSKSTTFPVDDLKTFDVLIGWIQLYVKIGDYTLKIAVESSCIENTKLERKKRRS